MPAVGIEAVEDLPGQLTGRAENQHAAGLWLRTDTGFEQTVQDRQRKGCSLARAGLGDADHVAAGQGNGDGLSLDRGGRDVIFFLKCTRDWIGKAEILKRGQSVAFYESMRASGRNAGYERVSWDTRVFGASVWLDE